MSGIGEAAAVITALSAAAEVGVSVYNASNKPDKPKLPKLPASMTEPEPASTTDLMAQRARARRAAADDRAGTLLTGPLGLVNRASGSTGGISTLLGG